MGHDWSFGDWGVTQRRNAEIVRYVSSVVADKTYRYFVHSDGHIFNEPEVSFLPECTGFDWQPPKPIEPPEGYRLLTTADTVLSTDKWWNRKEYWDDLSANSVAIGSKWNESDYTPMCRKIEPQYRPFANAAEFMPHRDRWVKFKGSTFDGASRVRGYDEHGVQFRTDYTYDDAFEKIVFEDGSPFGVCDGLT